MFPFVFFFISKLIVMQGEVFGRVLYPWSGCQREVSPIRMWHSDKIRKV